jgi:hypothetical protein
VWIFWSAITLAATLFVAGIMMMLRGMLANFALVDELNEKLPPNKQFNHFWWTPFKRLDFKEQYRATFPESQRLRRAYRMGMVGLVLSLAGILVALSVLPH